MAISEQERDAILDTIAAWPAEDQITLAREILQRAERHGVARDDRVGEGSPQRSTWDALYGIAANGKEPPSDEKVEQWLDERRMKEYDS